MDGEEADSLYSHSDSEDTLELRGHLPPAKHHKHNATTDSDSANASHKRNATTATDSDSANASAKTKKVKLVRMNKDHINIDMILNPEIKVPPAREIPPEWRNNKTMLKVIRENREADKACKALCRRG